MPIAHKYTFVAHLLEKRIMWGTSILWKKWGGNNEWRSGLMNCFKSTPEMWIFSFFELFWSFLCGVFGSDVYPSAGLQISNYY